LSVYARRFDSSAVADGPMFLVSDHLPFEEFGASISGDMQGNLVVAWQEPSGVPTRDGSGLGVYAQRFCNSDDPTCDVCVGYDDTIDTDGDGIADGCDPCTNVAGAREIDSVRVDIREKTSGVPQRANRIVFNADFDLPGGPASFADIDPLAEGMRVRVATPLGAAIADMTFVSGPIGGKGTRGWKTNAANNKWIYADKRNLYPSPEFFKLILKDRSTSAPNRVRLRVRGKQGPYEVWPAYVPLTASIALGDGDAAASGLCGEATFEVEDCSVVLGAAFKLRCDR
jgi:hypothetical protein